MKLFLVPLFGIAVGAILSVWFRKARRTSGSGILEQRRLSKWMRMSRDERNAFDHQEKMKTMERKKTLLDEIRKEYLQVKKVNQKKDKPPFLPKK